MSNEPIAIIGSGCRFPGQADSPAKLWELLSKPRDVLREIPADRYNAAGFYHPDGLHHGSSNVRHAYTLTEDVRTFDASFFQISANEAAAIDPQQRLLLEVVYEALESGGLPVENLRGSNTAIIVGQMCADYNDILTRDMDTLPTYFATGTSRAILANRVSYAFDWHGPSWTIDTACSSSLVAVHQAIQALRAGESRVAVAAGSNLLLGPEPYIAESKLKMLSPDGRSRMWDDRANGYARGDGVAAIVMKKLSTALEDGDSIECVIRATGVNQDGRTKGITMPSSDAQAELIRKTYKAGGLDLLKDRPQFFEAHGTGTKAGDPQEARAIFNAFFGPEADEDNHANLMVGSIKTIIGHTEGTAGLAGLFKASLALQNAQIPPNMHFRSLNPEIEPYWTRLRIPTELQPWPAHSGSVRRASVNSFGFGGTNAHAVLESYSNLDQQRPRRSDSIIMPFVFSAQSESALADLMERVATHIRQHPDTDLADLAWTLYVRRSLWPTRAACSGTNASDLANSLLVNADKIRTGSQSPVVKPVSIGQAQPRVLGIFTGQGAQWPAMGRELIRSSPWLERRVDGLEKALSRLPEEDRPTWSLKEEMLSPAAKVGEARLSQPLCTAVQILLVDCLKAAGIEFSAVVGHSSGEIGAAYAAECISGEAAMWIAYYRGLHTAQAGGQQGEPGGMLAAGTSMEDAQELCELPTFAGRLTVAASNSAASVTMSGDKDAVNHAYLVFQDEKKFARPLIVDKAYHSHHMRPCARPYGSSLEALRIQVKEPRCSWYSSVYDGNLITSAEGLEGQYWVENMCRPVLFSQAVTTAIQQSNGSYDLVLELGPHPALKGPATATIQDALKRELPYTGLLQRNSHDTKAFADAMSFIWARFGRDALKLPTLQAAFSDTDERYRLVRNLPSYPWDHSRPFWHESRVIHDELFRDSFPHPLLGNRQTSNPDHVQWRNILSLKEIPWLRGHSLQGQTIFPASGYISMAIEASRSVVGPEHSISLIEVLDLVIDRPITFDEDDAGADVVVTLANIAHGSQEGSDGLLTATFNCHTTAGRGSQSLVMAAHGRVCVTLGTPHKDTLPCARQVFEDVIQVDGERFYDGLKELGYDYMGPFKALDNLARYLNLSTGVVYQPASDAERLTGVLVHPAMLDASFQSVFLAYSWPGDGRLSSLHVPTSIKRVQVNPALCATSEKKFHFHTESEEGLKASINGDITLSRTANEPAAIRVEQITVVPVVPPTAADDRALFASEIWENADLDDPELASSPPSAEDEKKGREIIAAANKHLFDIASLDEYAAGVARIKGHLLALAESQEDGSTTAEGGHSAAAEKPDWSDPGNIDLTILTDTVNFLSQGDQEPTASHVQKLWETDLLSQYFQQGLGVASSNDQLGRLLRRLSHRYPAMDIVELNASNLSLTSSILQDINPGFSSYTLASPKSRMEVFKELMPLKARMSISAIDFKREVEEQGFAANQSDLIIATLVLSDAPVDDILKASRRLVRPGGYLFLQTVGEVARFDLYSDIAETMPLTVPEWHRQLRQHGFAGIDALYPSSAGQPLSIIVSQATNERVELLRQPLVSTSSDLDLSEVVLVGGTSMSTLRLIEDLSVHLSPKCSRITRRDSLNDLADNPINALSTIICLSDLDSPAFKNLREDIWNALKTLFDRSQNILWLLRGARSSEPYCNATVGFGRTARLEMPHVNLQFLDIGNDIEAADARVIAEHALRLCLFGIEGQDSASASSVLWSNEPELLIKKGKIYIPRVIPHKVQNDRYNASRRLVTQSVNPSETLICLQRAASGETTIHLDHALQLSPADNTVQVSVIYSTAQPLTLASGKARYLVFGRCKASDRTLFAMAPRLASQVGVEKGLCVFHGDKNWEVTPADLVLTEYLTTHVLIQSCLRNAVPKSSVVAFDVDPSSRTVLSSLARARGYNIAWATHAKSSHPDDVVLHRRASDRDLRASIPIRPSIVLDFSQSPQHDSAARRLSAMYDCRLIEMQRVRGAGACTLPDNNGVEALQQAYEQFRVDEAGDSTPSSGHLVNLAELPQTLDSPYALIDWQAQSVVAQLDSAEAQPLFHADRTYLLVGLTGGLGLSLCEWMVRLGARHLVITSRSPKVDERWIQSLHREGAEVTVIASDITDRKSVQTLYEQLKKTAPPIAGVVNGAMVLRDSSIYDMDVEKMLTVLRPKIDGSRYLDSIFTARHPLDFFIMLSSLTGACGNSGQANYTAANMFMAGLAAQRKERGLVGSVIDIGAMMGVGVLVRDRSYALQVQLRDYGYLWMSEYDFHQSFAEAILAGRPDNALENPQVLAGIRLCRRDQLKTVQWAQNPRFSHCILPTESVPSSAQGQAQSMVALTTRVAEAADEAEIRQIVEDAFLHKLVMALSLPELEDAPARARLLGQGVDELGVDSLVAVDIRSWWLRELRVDMPVLKIMGGTAITDLIAYAVKQLQPATVEGSTNERLDKASEQVDEASKQIEETSKQIEEETASIHSTDSSEAEEAVSTPLNGSIPSTATSEPDTTKTEPPPVVRREPMSYGQRRFWFLSKYLRDRTTFNITCLIRISGAPATDALARAVHALGNRHTALRTCFFEGGEGETWQGILPESTLELERGSVRNYDEAVEQFHLMHAHEYNLAMGESMRIMLLSGPSQSYYLLIGYHHINMDGISLQVVFKDLEAVYNGRALGPEPLQYHQFSTWQYQQVESNAVQSDIEYWRNELRDMPDVLPILSVSTRSTRQPMLQYAHHRVDFKVPRSLGAKIKQVARTHRATSFHFYLSVFKALLYRFSGSHDLVIGVADGNRNHLSGAPDSVGFYLNLLPVRLRGDGQDRFAQALKEARTQAQSALAHSKAPIDVLYNELQITRSSSYTPLFQAFVNYRQGAQESLPFGNCRLEGDKYEIGKTGYDISLDVIENAQSEATIMFITQSYLYSAEQTEVLAASFKQLLSAFSEDPETRLDEAQPYAAEDVDKAMVLSQGPKYALQWKGTLVDRVGEMVARFPQRPALEDGSLSVTYAEMSVRVHAIAALLLSHGVVPGWKVAVFQQPTIDWVCCMLAVLLIGAVYVPFDPKLSVPRLQRVAQSCKPEAVLIHSATAKDVPELLTGQPDVITIDVAEAKMTNQTTVANRSKADSAMFILYTSGSTGQPKGVILPHSAFAHKIETSSQMFALGPEMAMLQQSALTFDMSVAQAFMALCNGGRLFLLRREYRGDPAAILDRILEHGLTHSMATPSEYESWLQLANSLPQQASALAASKWQVLFSGGEKISDNLKHELRTLDKQDLQLQNVYGPTEVSIFSHSFEVDYRSLSNKPVPLGPVNVNYSAFVVDRNLKPVPVGVPGEILITGPGIALGYLNNEDLTREKFVPFTLPRSSSLNVRDRDLRGYRTGDRGRLRPDGILDFEGRIGGDTEIKLRGLRMDLNDIECALLEAAQGRLTTVVVTVRGDADAQYLLAHVVFHRKQQQQLSSEEQRAFVDALTPRLPLPQYMWPAAVIIADSLPVNSHGKVDRRAIETMPYHATPPINTPDIESSLTEAEAHLRTLWEEVLPPTVVQLHQIGPKSDFFHVGGNSMLLVKLQRSITRAFGRKIVLVDLFERTTLAKMAAYITDPDATSKTWDRIDWAQEIALDVDPIATQPPQPKPRRNRQGQTIILTGATGFLGQVLLQQLLADPTIKMIHCIAVRNPSRLLASAPADSISRVTIHSGDLALPLCGLDPETSDRIFASADIIIHNGADVHFLKTYPVMHSVNVASTKWLAHQARTHHLALHFISTASVIQFAPPSKTSTGFPATSVAAFPPPTNDGSGGYAASKWVSEMYLEQASQRWGVEVHIHRPTAITGPEAPAQDIFPNVVRFSRAMRAVPVLTSLLAGWLDFVDVENVARRILALVRSDSHDGDGDQAKGELAKFHHHAGDVVVPVEGFKDHLEKETGEEIRTLGLADWIQQAVQTGMSPMVGEYLKLLAGQQQPIFLPFVLPS
ncbi:nonribosomal peptide synthetase 14 [Aspergillus udagawae]|nr:nonribosomal peptide synthetase 14 [Aspergillus udagawae]